MLKYFFVSLLLLSISLKAMDLEEAREIPLGADVISYGPELSQEEISELFRDHAARYRGREIEFNVRCKWRFGIMYSFSGVVSQQNTPVKDENGVISITVNTSILCRS